MSAIVSNAEIVHYEVLGRGRPVIFLHGWAGSWRYWVPTMQALSNDYRTYALDFWGFGDTARVSDRYSLDSQTALLEAFIAELGIIGKVALVGHGLGALVALQYALRNDGKTARMLLSNCPLNGAYNKRLMNESPASLAGWLLPDDDEKKNITTEAEKADAAALAPSILDFQALSLQEKLPLVNVPILIFYSSNDPLVGLPAEPLPANYPDSIHSLVFEGSGHFPMLDEDMQFTRLLREFLELDKESSPRVLQFKDQWKRRVR